MQNVKQQREGREEGEMQGGDAPEICITCAPILLRLSICIYSATSNNSEALIAS